MMVSFRCFFEFGFKMPQKLHFWNCYDEQNILMEKPKKRLNFEDMLIRKFMKVD